MGAKGIDHTFFSSINGANPVTGSDLMLIRLAKEAFEASSWPTTIDTGRYMYPLANNTRKVENTISAKEGVFARVQNIFHS